MTTRTMTDARLDALNSYIGALLTELGLSEWEVRLKLDERPESDEAMASCTTIRNRLIASLRFAEDFFNEEPDRQRHYVTHELLHLLSNPLHEALESYVLDELMGKPAVSLHRSQMRDLVEQMVDRLTTIVAEHLPLPDFGPPPPPPPPSPDATEAVA